MTVQFATDRWRGLRIMHRESNIDGSGNISMPSDTLARLGQHVVLAPGLAANLCLYPQSLWTRLIDDYQSLPDIRSEARLTVDLLRSNSVFCELTTAGDVRVPDFLRRLARLRDEVILVSAYDHIQLWAPETWESSLTPQGQNLRHGVA